MNTFKKWINIKSITIDSKSGYSGAGRSVHKKYKDKNLYDSLTAYGVGFHRHNSEINQELKKYTNSKVDLSIFKGSWPKGKQKIFDTPHAEAEYIKTVIRHEAGVYDKQIQSRRLARSASQTMKWED